MTHVTFLAPAKVQFLCKPTTILLGRPQSAIRRIGSRREYVALADRAAHGANLDRGDIDLTARPPPLHDILTRLISIDDGSLEPELSKSIATRRSPQQVWTSYHQPSSTLADFRCWSEQQCAATSAGTAISLKAERLECGREGRGA
jgi:hypothetical protein